MRQHGIDVRRRHPLRIMEHHPLPRRRRHVHLEPKIVRRMRGGEDGFDTAVEAHEDGCAHGVGFGEVGGDGGGGEGAEGGGEGQEGRFGGLRGGEHGDDDVEDGVDFLGVGAVVGGLVRDDVE